MNPICPSCEITSGNQTHYPKTKRIGFFKRKSDSRRIQRFRCLRCLKSFSFATISPCFRQKKRFQNEMIRRLLASGVSQRRAARILMLNRKTIVRKFLFLADAAKIRMTLDNFTKPRVESMQFDDLETFEHTKCKPLSVTLALDDPSRRILGFEVSVMPCKGRLANRSRKKYGPRPDGRSFGRQKLFRELQNFVQPHVKIKSDSNPHYVTDVQTYFPKAHYQTVLGGRGSSVGGGEIKRLKFDPLFNLNHTFAKSRADICRLIRKTWSTTKRRDRLSDHLAIFAVYHNESLKTHSGGPVQKKYIAPTAPVITFR